MCSKEDVTKIVAESETRLMGVLNAEMQKFREEIKRNNECVVSDTQRSHSAVAGTISGFGDDIKNMQKLLNTFISTYSAKVDDLVIWKAVHQSEAKAISESISRIETTLKIDIAGVKDLIIWGAKIVVGAVIMAILGTVIINI